MFCHNCGKEVEKGEIYCTSCGTKLVDESVQNNTKNSPKASLIFGILACALFWLPLISIPFAIVSIVTGINERNETNNSIAGIILGIVSIILNIVMVIIIIFLCTIAINEIDEFTDDYQEDSILNKYNEYYQRQEQEEIKGYNWKADDKSLLQLYDDETYTWYQTESNKKDNYYQGKYKIYQGQKAIDYIANYLKQFGLTEEKQKDFFDKNNYKLEDYYLIILTCEKTKINEKESYETNNKAYYYGFYSKNEKRLSLTNLTTMNKAGFTKGDKLNNIDV